MKEIPPMEAIAAHLDQSRRDAALLALDALAAEVAAKWSVGLSAANAVDEQRLMPAIPTRSP